MKLADLERKLKGLGWWDTGKGGKHTKWTNGTDSQPVPRHKEINEHTAKSILNFVEKHPPKKNEDNT